MQPEQSNNNSIKHPPYWTVGFSQRLWWIFTKLPFKFFAHLKIYGRENFAHIENGIIFASNHVSELDGELISESFGLFSKRIPFFYVTRERSFYKEGFVEKYIFTQTVLHLAGAYPVLIGIRNFEKSLADHIKLLKKHNNVVIFPEGKRSRDGNLLEAKGGVVALAKYSRAPIVPVAISGILHITPSDFLLRRRYVTVRFGKPIYPDELFLGCENPDPSEFARIANEKIMPKIAELLQP